MSKGGAGILVLAAMLGVIGCGRTGSRDDASAKTPGSHRDVCVIIEVPRKDILEGTPFAELLERPADDRDLLATASAIALVRSKYDGGLGPYEAAIDHFAEVGRVNADGRGTPPRPDAKVRTSARTLDRDLADGLCT
jgi:hypothetical protein